MTQEQQAISRLAHTRSDQAIKIWSLFNAAYRLEAGWLGVKEFPPLNRTIIDLQTSHSEFWGLMHGNDLLAVIEYINHGSWIKVDNLAVSPDHLRQGHGRALLTFLLAHYPGRIIEVETALSNQAAVGLYEGAGFKIISQYEAAESLVKVLFRKTPTKAVLY